MTKSSILRILITDLCIIFISLSSCTATDTITVSRPLTDDAGQSQTIVSQGGEFEMGFFYHGNQTSRRYLGIRYRRSSPKTVVWVANREQPLNSATGVLKINGTDGNLVLVDQITSTVYWSTATSGVRSPVAQLQDSGNLVLNESKTGVAVWQSLEHPGNTQLPGMRIGTNLRTRNEWFLSSWKTADDPAVGDYTLRLEFRAYPALVIKEGSMVVLYRFPLGGLDGIDNDIYQAGVVSDADNMYSYFTTTNPSTFSISVLNHSGFLQHLLWDAGAGSWKVLYQFPSGPCDRYNRCGEYGVCNDDELFCGCLPGFETKRPKHLNTRDGSDRCERRTKLECWSDGFTKVSSVKLPDQSNAVVDMTVVSKERCQEVCMRNCSCTAYGIANAKTGAGCITWDGKLVDVMLSSGEGGQEFYLRLAASEIAAMQPKPKIYRRTIIILVVSISVMLVLVSCVYYLGKNRKKNKPDRNAEDPELPIFDFNTITLATNNFSEANKIGKGGFGVVYKGILQSAQEIAVKKLSITSTQIVDEFMNEARLIAKLQHRNLVRLLGCCIQGEERMLVYEYMPNKSLDRFIFDETRRAILNWSKRMEIIMGIARGIHYLHHDSRFRIVHRDLKAGNILLDQDMNAKIADFGTARIFGSDQMEDTTKRVMGTYGYMSPEYAIDGIISMKSDVFSFGVLLLEVVSGKRNRGVYFADSSLNLLAYAWQLWTEGRITELLDDKMTTSCPVTEAKKCIQVGLLCVQSHAVDRPTMSSVLMMLCSDNDILAQPNEPGYLKAVTSNPGGSSYVEEALGTVNFVTLTGIIGR